MGLKDLSRWQVGHSKSSLAYCKGVGLHCPSSVLVMKLAPENAERF